MLQQLEETDLKLLRVFQAVARCGGFSAARVELGSSQSTISTQMAQLEGRLEMHLCHRGQAGFGLTDDGQVVLDAAQALFGALDEFRNELNESRSELRGELRLGCVDNLVTHPAGRIPAALGRFRDAAPAAEIRLEIGSSVELASRVLDGRLDAGIGLFDQRSPGLRHRQIFTEEHMLYCAKGHPLFDLPDDAITAADLEAADYVGWGSLEARMAESAAIRFGVSASTPFVEGVALLIHSGRFFGYLPTHYAQPWSTSGHLRALLPGEATRNADVLVATRKEALPGRLLQRFLNELAASPSA